MTGEYGVECRMEPLGYSLARWVGGGWDAIERADKVRWLAVSGWWQLLAREMLDCLV